ncbi:MAG: chemotaxis protein MotB [Nitrospirota bacterium]|nr:chemotaxis protein MotB [Nitrospirota bacterium]
MKTTTSLLLLALSIWVVTVPAEAQSTDTSSIRFGESALAFAAGAIQKTTPRDGIVNLITGDNQSTGDRMILGSNDALYLKLDNPHDVAPGDLYTVYRRVRKVFHPATGDYLGFVVVRLAVVQVTQTDHALTTVVVVRSYGAIAPGDPVMRFVPPVVSEEPGQVSDVAELRGMIVELQSDKPMTLVAQSDIVYLDRGNEDGLRKGDLLELHRHSQGLPPRKIGQLKVVATEDRTATAVIMRVSTRVMKGDRFKLAGHSAPLVLPIETPAQPKPLQAEKTVAAIPSDLVARKLKVQDAAGESRLNLGEVTNFLRYDSGEASIRPEGYKVLDQLIEYLRTSGDARMIRVEGHADNVEIGPALKSRYPSNWELSKARASGVLRYLVEKGGLDSARLASVGYGDGRPVATNATEEGRTSNRRVEILLYAPTSTEARPPQPAVTNTAGKPDSDPASLSAKGNGDPAASAPTAQDGIADPSISHANGQEALPATDSPGTLSLPDSSGKPDISDPAAQDSAAPAGRPLE